MTELYVDFLGRRRYKWL